MLETVKIDKLVHGGQGIGDLADGRKVFVWGALPQETVSIRVTKKRKDYCEAIVEEVIAASAERIEPIDEAFLSTSPWQILNYEAENKYKKQILFDAMAREHVDWTEDINFKSNAMEWHYRNKMEYSFWADDDGLHLALFHRGSHGKRIVEGSSIARPEIDETANKILAVLNENNIRGSQLKTVIVRCNQKGETVAALFVKDDKFPKLSGLELLCKGIEVCFSTPKSPASVITKKLYCLGKVTLQDEIEGKQITYGVYSFFQVNLPIFQEALDQIVKAANNKKNIVDLYCGVGTIGSAVNANVFVDIDQNNCKYAEQNIGKSGEVVQASSEQVTEYINEKSTLIVDPPRAGLHVKLIDRINDVKPEKVIYLSCNPSTQARDLALLQENYEIAQLVGYNFFPRTPHIESLAVMIRR